MLQLHERMVGLNKPRVREARPYMSASDSGVVMRAISFRKAQSDTVRLAHLFISFWNTVFCQASYWIFWCTTTGTIKVTPPPPSSHPGTGTYVLLAVEVPQVIHMHRCSVRSISVLQNLFHAHLCAALHRLQWLNINIV